MLNLFFWFYLHSSCYLYIVFASLNLNNDCHYEFSSFWKHVYALIIQCLITENGSPNQHQILPFHRAPGPISELVNSPQLSTPHFLLCATWSNITVAILQGRDPLTWLREDIRSQGSDVMRSSVMDRVVTLLGCVPTWGLHLSYDVLEIGAGPEKVDASLWQTAP